MSGLVRPRGSVDTAAAAPPQPSFTNDDVLKLVAVGLADEVVIAKIKNAPDVRFDVTTEALVALKGQKVSGSVVAAMIDRAAEKPKPTSAESPSTSPSRTNASTPCSGIEMMGFYKNEIFDRAMGGGVVEWLAKIRNNTSVTKIVVFGWIDMYGEQKRSQVQIRGGEIASVRVDLTQARAIAPVRDLQIQSCE